MRHYRMALLIVPFMLLWRTVSMGALLGCDVRDVAWHPTADLFAFNCHEIVHIYTTQFEHVKTFVPPPEPPDTFPTVVTLKWSPNGLYLAAVILRADAPGGDGRDSRLLVWEVAASALILDIANRAAPIAWSPDSSLIATDSLSMFGSMYFYDVSSGREVGNCLECNGASDIGWSPNDIHQFVASFSSLTLFIDPLVLETPPVSVQGISLVGDGYSPDGTRIVFYNRSARRIEVQDAYTRQVLATLSFELTGPINSYHWLADGIYIDNANPWTVRWDGRSRQIDILPEGQHWKPDGSLYVSSNRTGIFIYETLTGDVKAQLLYDEAVEITDVTATPTDAPTPTVSPSP